MLELDLTELRDHVRLTRNYTVPSERSAFFERVRNGDFVSLFRGVYLRGSVWHGMDRHEQHRALVRAAAIASDRRDLVFSHASAAAMWRLPWLGELPRQAHITVPEATGGRSRRMFARHATGAVEGVVIDGVTVTELARTVVDVARTTSLENAVAVADAALRRTAFPVSGVPATDISKADLLDELRHVPLRQGAAKARHVIQFADARAELPGESLSRVTMSRLGLPAPQLQVELEGTSGRRYVVDFWWPDIGLIGEFDGRVKYDDPAFMSGRTAEQVVVDEKLREDDLRAAGHRFARWDWQTAASPSLLLQRLARAGLT